MLVAKTVNILRNNLPTGLFFKSLINAKITQQQGKSKLPMKWIYSMNLWK
jgi:hypothetical protein